MQRKEVTGEAGKTLFALLSEEGMGKLGFCGGKGRCGKCQVQILEGYVEPSVQDRKLFTEEELRAGYRLSCTCRPEKGQALAVAFQKEGELSVVSGYGENEGRSKKFSKTFCRPDGTKNVESVKRECTGELQHGIAVDIGTTTIAMQLVSWKKDGTFHIEKTYVASNSQRGFGADVISRILAAQEGHGKELYEMLHADVQKGYEELFNCYRDFLSKNGICTEKDKKSSCRLSEKREIEKDKEDALEIEEQLDMILAMNTTMQHLFLGYDCQGLGQAPFRPFSVEAVKTKNMWIFPGSSAFIGGDIVSGLLACGFEKREKPALFLDLGTNGEMVVGTKDGFLSASAAAGPAFEGGNMECGSPGIRGAVCKVEYLGKKIQRKESMGEGKEAGGRWVPVWGERGLYVKTIGGGVPCGICGTGMVDAVAALLDGGFLDETGLLLEELREEGITLGTSVLGKRIYISQKDIREFQMAKAAVRAGIDVLLKAYGCGYEELDQVYLAGGFGQKLSVENAVRVGLLPAELKEKTVAAGNTALYGAVLALARGEDARNTACTIAGRIREHTLASDPLFSGSYMEGMFF